MGHGDLGATTLELVQASKLRVGEACNSFDFDCAEFEFGLQGWLGERIAHPRHGLHGYEP
jgi:hypothetical protein